MLPHPSTPHPEPNPDCCPRELVGSSGPTSYPPTHVLAWSRSSLALLAEAGRIRPGLAVSHGCLSRGCLSHGGRRRDAMRAGHDGTACDAVPQAQAVQLGLDGVLAAAVGTGQLRDAPPGPKPGRQLAGLAVVPALARARREAALVAGAG